MAGREGSIPERAEGWAGSGGAESGAEVIMECFVILQLG